MTSQRRTHLLVLALVPLVVFGAVRCADNTTTSPLAESALSRDLSVSAKLAKLHKENDWVGKFHNEALAFVLAELQRTPKKGRDRRSVCETARRAYAEFHRSRRGTEVPASVDADFESFCAGNKGAANTRLSSIAVPSRPRTDEVSLAAQDYMDRVASAIDLSTSYDDLSGRVNSIEAEAASSLSYDEAGEVVTVGSVALSSADYWGSTITDWVPFTSGIEAYSVLLAPGGRTSPFSTGAPAKDWNSIWNDAKQAAKRAASGDVHGAVRTIVSLAMVGGAFQYEIVLAGAATSSVMAILQM
jgi:hypothetical protein